MNVLEQWAKYLASGGLVLCVLLLLDCVVRPMIGSHRRQAVRAGSRYSVMLQALARTRASGRAAQGEDAGAVAAASPGVEDEAAAFQERLSRMKPSARPGISADMLDMANTYDDKVALVRMLVTQDSARVAKVLKALIRRN